MYNWIRVRDAAGNRFDVREDTVLDDGVTVVKGYPVHRSQTARPGKSHVDLRADRPTGYADMTVPQLNEEISRRNADGRDAAIVLASNRKADLIGALEADDNTNRVDVDVTNSSDDPSDTGENSNQTETGSTGQESE